MQGVPKERERRFDAGLNRLMSIARRGEPMTLDFIAKECGVSFERIRQIERKALIKLRLKKPKVLMEAAEILRSR